MEDKQLMTAIKALKTIQQECKSNDNCNNCPYDGTICTGLPESWKLNTLEYKLLHGGDPDGN